jgi:hypothetical protein
MSDNEAKPKFLDEIPKECSHIAEETACTIFQDTHSKLDTREAIDEILVYERAKWLDTRYKAGIESILFTATNNLAKAYYHYRMVATAHEIHQIRREMQPPFVNPVVNQPRRPSRSNSRRPSVSSNSGSTPSPSRSPASTSRYVTRVHHSQSMDQPSQLQESYLHPSSASWALIASTSSSSNIADEDEDVEAESLKHQHELEIMKEKQAQAIELKKLQQDQAMRLLKCKRNVRQG